MSDNQLKLSNPLLVFSCHADTVKISHPHICFLCKEKDYLSVKNPILVFMQQGTKQEVSFANPRFIALASKLTKPVCSDFGTCRTIRDIDYSRYLEFNGTSSKGKASNVLAGKKEFTIVLKVATTDTRKADKSYVYNFPCFLKIDEPGDSNGEIGVGVDNGNAYVWSNMGDGGDIS